MKLMSFQDIENQTLALSFGFIIGDCLGVPVEFEERGTFEVTDMRGDGTYSLPAGTWSDDTSLTLCLMENILENGNTRDLMKKFSKYKNHGYLTPYGKMFDIGITTEEAIERFEWDYEEDTWGGRGEYNSSNGALMRISPLFHILSNEADVKKRADTVIKYTKITHNTLTAITASIIYVECLIELSKGNSLKDSLSSMNKRLADSPWTEEISKNFSRIFSENFFNLASSEIQSGGYAVASLEAALWSVGTTNSYKEAVLKAVNLGSDTDTVGAITGSLAGLIYCSNLENPLDGFPKDWLDKIANRELIDDIVLKFAKSKI